MRGLAVITTIAVLAACRPGATKHTGELPLEPTPSKLDLGTTVIGAPKTSQLTLRNPNAFDVAFTLSTEGPFEAPAEGTVPGGASLALPVRFLATTLGVATGRLRLGTLVVPLRAEAVEAPPCPSSSACRTSAYDPALHACADTALPDGTDCTASAACFAEASCRAGECVGTRTTCDDGDPCTLDICGTLGCGHLDAVDHCPLSTNPCEAPTCSSATGCAQAPVMDGTACGTRDCTSAKVCISGSCVTRAVPQNQACVDVLTGVPAGMGTADGPADVARFTGSRGMAFDAQGNLFMLDGCALRKVTPAGVVTTVVGEVWTCEHRDGFGRAARLGWPYGIVFDGSAFLVRDACAIRRVTPQGLITTLAGGAFCESQPKDGIGAQARLVASGVGEGFVRTAAGRMFFLDGNALPTELWLREVTSAGEVLTRAKLSFTPTVPTDDVFIWGLAAQPDGRLFCFEQDQAPDDSRTDQWLAQVLPDGQVKRLSQPNGYSLGTTPTGIVSYGGTSMWRLAADGGTVDWWESASPAHADGPRGIAAFQLPLSYAVDARGALAFFDGANHDVRVIHASQMTTLAGPRPDRQLVDGPGPLARLSWPTGIAVSPTGDVTFTDYYALRRLSPLGAVTTVQTGAGLHDGPLLLTGLGFPMQPIALSDDALAFTGEIEAPDGGPTPAGLRLVSWDAGTVTTVVRGLTHGPRVDFAVTSSGQWVWEVDDARLHTLENGVDVALTPPAQTVGALVRYGDGLLYVEDSCRLMQLGADAGVSLVDAMACGPEPSLVKRLFTDAAGDVYTIDEFHNLVRKRDRSTGTWTTLLELSDHPIDAAFTPSGDLLVLVPEAILRLRP